MPRGTRVRTCGGQSIVELVVVLALVAIVATAVVKGIGQQSAWRMESVHAAFADSGPSSGAAAAGGTESGSGSGVAGSDNASSSTNNGGAIH